MAYLQQRTPSAAQQLHHALAIRDCRVLTTQAGTQDGELATWLVCRHQQTGHRLVVQLFADGGAILWAPLVGTHDLQATIAMIV